MFEVTVSDEFSRWFATLGGRELEEIASALDVLAALGPALDPVKASRWLLWFDGTLHGRAGPLVGLDLELTELSAQGDRLRDLMEWQSEVLRCLDSQEFTARLAALQGEEAATVLKAIERVHEVLRAARALESLRALMDLSAGGPISRNTARYLASSVRPIYSARAGKNERAAAAQPRELVASLKQAFFEVLSLVGLDPKQIHDPESGLRELTIGTLSPRIRILYGIDVPQRRLIVLLGEPLVRAYYGDSVRFAERRFWEYMQGEVLAGASPT